MKRLISSSCGMGLMLAACGGGGGGGDAAAGWTDLISRSWSLSAGTEGYRCRAVQAAQDMTITGFRPVLPAGQFEMTVTVSDTAPASTGDFNCSAGTGTLSDRMIYSASAGTDEIVFPAGIGVRVRAGQYLTLNLHVVNAQVSGTLSGDSGVMARVVPAAEVTTEADMIFAGTTNIFVPSDNMIHEAVGGCTAPEKWNVFALSPRMRSRGLHQKLAVNGVAAHDEDFAVGQQVFFPKTPPVAIPAGAQVQVRCSYVSGTGGNITAGDSSDKEACFSALYRYPAVAGSTALDCVSN